MPFSMGSYLLGVGTVVGALAFGFGGGVLLTHTAIKESSAGQTKVERLARAGSRDAGRPASSGRAGGSEPGSFRVRRRHQAGCGTSATVCRYSSRSGAGSSPDAEPRCSAQTNTGSAQASGEGAAAAEAGRTIRTNGSKVR